MAAKDAVKTEFFDHIKYTWSAVAEGDTFTEVYPPTQHQDRSLQVEGTFGGATVTATGSDNGTNFRALSNPATGTGVSLTAAGIQQILEATLAVKPSASGGSAQSLNVTLLVSKKR